MGMQAEVHSMGTNFSGSLEQVMQSVQESVNKLHSKYPISKAEIVLKLTTNR